MAKDFKTPLQKTIAEATAAPETEEAQAAQDVKETEEVQAAQDVNVIEEAQAAPGKKKRKARKDDYTDEEIKAALYKMRTNGLKGVKLPRINLAFRPDIYEFTRTMAAAAGMNYTAFINMILEQYMNEHIDAYKQALEFRKQL